MHNRWTQTKCTISPLVNKSRKCCIDMDSKSDVAGKDRGNSIKTLSKEFWTSTCWNWVRYKEHWWSSMLRQGPGWLDLILAMEPPQSSFLSKKLICFDYIISKCTSFIPWGVSNHWTGKWTAMVEWTMEWTMIFRIRLKAVFHINTWLCYITIYLLTCS